MEKTKSEAQRTRKKKASSASTTSKSSKEKPGVFGANKVSIGEDASVASFLIGGIVEKGISENMLNKPSGPIPPPNPTVFPFPVARHRAHGPYWNALASKKGGNEEEGEEGEDDDDDDDPTDFNPAFANPPERRKKKDLDLSGWNKDDKMQENGDSIRKLKKEGKAVDDFNTRNSLSRTSLVNQVPVEVDGTLESAAYMGSESLERSYDSGNHSDISSRSWKGEAEFTEEQPTKVKKKRVSFAEPSIGVTSAAFNDRGTSGRSMSLESEIDAENHGRIQNMSPEEIAEAQAELMEKMNPTLLNLLKKRGQQKLNKQNPSESDVVVKSKPANGPSIKDSSAHSLVANGGSDLCKTQNSRNANPVTPNDVGPNIDPSCSNAWNTWSQRVEAARGLRFSLDASLVSVKFENGCTPSEPSNAIDSVAERDILRTEGDPAGAGYSIQEAVQLTRSVIPGQRVHGLRLLALVLDKAMENITLKEIGNSVTSADQLDKIRNTLTSADQLDKFVDWEAVWAYALGPEPELVLAVRMCLDDDHVSVVRACTNVILYVLSYDLNERIFQISEKLGTYGQDLLTAPVFRSKPEINGGFLHGGFWKYSAKPSNILAYAEDIMDEDGNEEEPTIQDDIMVAGQDFAAGLVRMGILPRMYYLLEMNPTEALEECILSILIAVARHSPTCASAIMKCQGLVEIVVTRFQMDTDMGVRQSKIKSVKLMKVLAQSGRNNCVQFIKDESFHHMTRNLYQYTSSLDEWVKSGKQSCRLSAALKVEQLKFWKVCIDYGFSISDFADIFPALWFWLTPPTFEKLEEQNIVSEFASVSRQAYLVLEALARKLPTFYSQKLSQNQEIIRDGDESWSWSYVIPVVDLALKWISWKLDSHVSQLFKSDFMDSSVSSLLWVYSAVMQMFSTLLLRVKPEETGSNVPWLPEFVPKIGLEMLKNGFFGSFVMELCRLRERTSHDESSLASVSCLNAMLLLAQSVDELIQSSMLGVDHQSSPQGYTSSDEGKLLEEGILNRSMVELKHMLDLLTRFVTQDWEIVQSIEVFGRGGPAPGVGLGWGATCGGFWSLAVLVVQANSKLLIDSLEIFCDLAADREITSTAQRIDSVLRVCLTLGPRDTYTAEKALNFLLQVPVLCHLNACINGGSSSLRPYTDEEYQLISKTLASHFRRRWLSMKKKSKPLDGNKSSSKANKPMPALETIQEEEICRPSTIISCISFAHQRLPLPMHWFLSPISEKNGGGSSMAEPADSLEVIKAGLFFLLGVEAMSSLLPNDAKSPVRETPLVWKLHSLSVALLIGMGVLEDERSKEIFEILQNLYGRVLDEKREGSHVEFLRFKSDVHDTYSTFLEALVDKFAADSYGDLIFGRQIAIFLHRCAETPVRVAAWTILSNSRVLEILPPLDKCVGREDGYLEPVENDEAVLEGYLKSWVSGALDRAATRGSMAFTLAIHHLSSFVFFRPCSGDSLTLRNKLARSLIRDYSQKPNHKDMMLELVKCSTPSAGDNLSAAETSSSSITAKRFEILAEACDGNSSLLSQVEKLKSAFASTRM